MRATAPAWPAWVEACRGEGYATRHPVAASSQINNRLRPIRISIRVRQAVRLAGSESNQFKSKSESESSSSLGRSNPSQSQRPRALAQAGRVHRQSGEAEKPFDYSPAPAPSKARFARISCDELSPDAFTIA